MTASQEQRILLIIGGGIAAYKTLDLIRRLRERGFFVRAMMTEAAQRFVTKLAVESLTGNRVFDDLFALTEDSGMGHIELSRDADLLVVAPATADIFAKMAHGLAGDLASTLLLATDKKILAAPAMNLRMWLHPATQRNTAILQKDGVVFVGPEDGGMACGEYGPGRMSEPVKILGAIEHVLASGTRIALPEDVSRNQVATRALAGDGRAGAGGAAAGANRPGALYRQSLVGQAGPRDRRRRRRRRRRCRACIGARRAGRSVGSQDRSSRNRAGNVETSRGRAASGYFYRRRRGRRLAGGRDCSGEDQERPEADHGSDTRRKSGYSGGDWAAFQGPSGFGHRLRGRK